LIGLEFQFFLWGGPTLPTLGVFKTFPSIQACKIKILGELNFDSHKAWDISQNVFSESPSNLKFLQKFYLFKHF